MSFDTFGLTPLLIKAISENGFENPTPIQKEAIPYILKGKDLLGIAKTGSGKTLSYVCPILQQNLLAKRTLENRAVRSLIVVPTRELAVQVQEVIEKFSNKLDVRINSMAVFGGVSVNPQMQNLNKIDILVATPGRLLELVEKNAVKLNAVETLVLD